MGVFLIIICLLFFRIPSLQTVRDIIFKRSVVKVGDQRIGLTDNRVVEKALGDYDIICIEDIVNEIYTLGPHFTEVFNYLLLCLLRLMISYGTLSSLQQVRVLLDLKNINYQTVKMMSTLF